MSVLLGFINVLNLRFNITRHVQLHYFYLIAKGRQRFNVISFRRQVKQPFVYFLTVSSLTVLLLQADGNLIGSVKIRPEIRLSPLVQAVIGNQTYRFLFPNKRRRNANEETLDNEPTTRKLAKMLSTSSTMSEEDPVDADLALMQKDILEQRQIRKYYAAFTPFPYWVYEQYDESVLVERVHRKLRVELKGLTESSHIPKDATELSFWLAQSLPIDDDIRLKILKMDSPVFKANR